MGGSLLLPTFGNPTGTDMGLNPNSMQQAMSSMALFNPSFNKGTADSLGSNGRGGSPFMTGMQPTPGAVPGSNVPGSMPLFPVMPGGAPNNGMTPKINVTGVQAPQTDTGIVPAGTPGAPQAPMPGAAPSGQPQFGYNTPPDPHQLANLTPGGGYWSPSNPSGLDPRLAKDLDKTYGKGFGQTIMNLLSTGAGYNPTIANAFLTDIQPYFQQNMNQMMEYFGAGGSRFSSGSALAAGQATASFSAQQMGILANLYQWAYGNYLQVLMQAGSKNTGSDIFGTIGNILGLAGTLGKGAAAGASAAGVGGTLGSVLGGIAAL